MDNNAFFKKMLNEHSGMNFSIYSDKDLVFWKARSFIDKRGELKIKVFDRHKHKGELYIKHDLSVGISGKNKDIPVYVCKSVENRIKDMKKFYDEGIPSK